MVGRGIATVGCGMALVGRGIATVGCGMALVDRGIATVGCGIVVVGRGATVAHDGSPDPWKTLNRYSTVIEKVSFFGALMSRPRDEIRARIIGTAVSEDILVQSESCVVVAPATRTLTRMAKSPAVNVAFSAIDGSPFLYDGETFSRPARPELLDMSWKPPEVIQHHLMGQYCLVRGTTMSIDLIADPNSLRSIFIYQEDGLVLFASRFHEIARMVSGLELDFHAFGSHWLAHNQLSNRFFVKGVTRLAGRNMVRLRLEHGTIRSEEIEIASNASSSRQMTFGRERPGNSDPFSPLSAFLSSHDGPVRLALSGGLDSRLLLALSVAATTRQLSTFVYDDPDRPEGALARGLAAAMGVPCEPIAPSKLHPMIESGLLQRFAREGFCLTPLSAASQLCHYEHLFKAEPEAVLIDGAFGEIGRTQFYRRIELTRRLSAVKPVREEAWRRGLSFRRADVFSPDIQGTMDAGYESDVQAFVRRLRSSDADRPEDELGIMFRRSNFFGYGQAWLDQFGYNMMPFGQNPLVDSLLEQDLIHRRGGSLYRRTIRRIAPPLARFPLSKGATIYPFSLPGFLVPAYGSFLRRWGQGAPRRTSPWIEEREFVMDLFHSSSIRNYSGYDTRKVDALAKAWYRSDDPGATDRCGAELDWFLSFELWRSGNGLS